MIRKMHGWLTSDDVFFSEDEEGARRHEAQYEFEKYYNDIYLSNALFNVSAKHMMGWLEEHSTEVCKYLHNIESE